MIGEAIGTAHMGTAMSVDVGANNASRMVGPTVGGLLLAGVGIDGVFTLSVALYAIAVVAACRVRYRNSFPPNATESVLARIAEGLRLVRNDRRLIGTLTVTVIYNVFGWPFTSMVPVIGQDRLMLGPEGIGILASMDGVGAFAGAVLMAMFCKPRFYRTVYVGGVSLYMVMLIVFALVPLPAVAERRCFSPFSAARFQHHAGDAGVPVVAAGDAQPHVGRAVCVHRRRTGRLRRARLAGRCDRRALGHSRDRLHGPADDVADAAAVADDLTRTGQGEDVMSATSNPQPIVHFVGSIPLADAETVFRTLSAVAGPDSKRLPTARPASARPGSGSSRVVLADNPAIEVADVPPFKFIQWDGKLLREIPRLRIKPGATPDPATFETGYARMAMELWAVFDRLQQAGVIPAGVKFQISLPTPIAPTYNNMVPADRAGLLPALTQHFIGEVETIAQTLPNDRIAIQWDVCQEVLAWEGYYEPVRWTSTPRPSTC